MRVRVVVFEDMRCPCCGHGSFAADLEESGMVCTCYLCDGSWRVDGKSLDGNGDLPKLVYEDL